jgi:cation diffusion facilitator family transporter
MKQHVRITVVGIILNCFLFIIKLLGGLFSGSLALLSDSFNSLTDIFSSLAIFLAVKIGAKKADHDHPFGHRRAEPIAGLVIAIFAAILGFQVLSDAFRSFFEPRDLSINLVTFVIITVSIAVKVYMYVLFRVTAKRIKSPALKASAVDYRNDILVSVSVLIGAFFGYIGYPIGDTIVAILIGGFILYSGFKIGMENLDFLMGKVPGKEIIERLKTKALSIDGVMQLNEIRAHYLGNFIQVEIHIEVNRRMSTQRSHNIATQVQTLIQEEEIVDYAFVHVDPV